MIGVVIAVLPESVVPLQGNSCLLGHFKPHTSIHLKEFCGIKPFRYNIVSSRQMLEKTYVSSDRDRNFIRTLLFLGYNTRVETQV